MSGEGAAFPSEAASSWMSPGKLLAFFCTMELLVYIDRGVIASNGVLGSLSPHPHGVQGDFQLSLSKLSWLPAAFMIGLLLFSPVFAQASKHFGGLRLIACGLALWTFAAAGCGLSIGFWSLLFCRMVVGVGEASFVALAAPFIDDAAPKESKTLWLATFYLCIPTGYAIGYLAGGFVAAPLGWRAPFLLEAAIMAPFVVLCMCLPPIKLKAQTPVPKKSSIEATAFNVVLELLRDIRVLLQHPVYDLLLAGNAIYTGVIGAYAFLGPKAGAETFGVDGSTADYVFGGVTVVTGVFGTLVGGLILDRVGSSIANALYLCGACCVLGCCFVLLAFGLAKTLSVFVAPFAAGELALFALQAPVNAVALWAVPAELRPLSMSLAVVVIHSLGDVPSPIVLGHLQDKLHNWRLSMAICTATLVVAAAFLFGGAIVSPRCPDYRKEDRSADADERSEEHSAGAAENDSASRALLHDSQEELA